MTEISKPAFYESRQTLAFFLNLSHGMAEADPPPPPVKTDEQASSQPSRASSSTTAQSQSRAAWTERTDTNLNATSVATGSASDESREQQIRSSSVAQLALHPHQQKRFSCFLSHYKREAGTEARLVKMKLKEILASKASTKELFLDSGVGSTLTPNPNPSPSRSHNPDPNA